MSVEKQEKFNYAPIDGIITFREKATMTMILKVKRNIVIYCIIKLLVQIGLLNRIRTLVISIILLYYCVIKLNFF